MPQNMIEINALEKSYGAVRAVQGTSFYVQQGALFALLGENGAGKSTIIDILATLLKPDAGTVHLDGLQLGRDDVEIRQRIGIVFQQSVLDDVLTVRENLMVRGSMYDLNGKALTARIEELAKPLGIDDFIDRRYAKLSGGQRRRADIARALLHTPQVLFLDEPTTGLDPASRKAIWEIVHSMQRASGTTVLLTTHYMEEAARSDYVVVIGHGKVLARGTPPALKETYAGDTLRFEPKNAESMAARLAEDGLPFKRAGAQFVIELTGTLDALPLLHRYGQDLLQFEVVAGTMDEAFLNIIQSDKEDA